MSNPIPPPISVSDIWPMVTEIGKAEREFNSLQSSYRKLASTWLFAVFGALGFLLAPIEASNGTIRIGVEQPLFVVGLGAAGYFGIVVLWFVDVPVYHRLLLAYFREGLQLEKDHSWLPQIRHDMKESPAIIVATLFYIALATAAFGASYVVLLLSGHCEHV